MGDLGDAIDCWNAALTEEARWKRELLEEVNTLERRIDETFAPFRQVSNLREKRDTRALCAMLREPSDAVQSVTVTALAEIGDPAALPALGELLTRCSNEFLRAKVVGVLAGLGGVEYVLVAAQDESEVVLQAVAVALAKVFQDSRVPIAVIELLGHPSLPTKSWIAWSLGKLNCVPAGRALADALETAPPEIHPHLATALLRLSPVEAQIWTGQSRAIPILLTFLRNDPATIGLLYGPCGYREKRGDDVEYGAASDEARALRPAAALALGLVGNPEMANLLGIYLDRDRCPGVRASCAVALGRLGGAGALEALSHAIEDSDVEVRRCAVTALAAFGDSAADVLSRVLKNEPPDLCQTALGILESLASKEAATAITAGLGSASQSIRQASGKALLRLGLVAIEPLCESMTSFFGEKERAAKVLLQFEPKVIKQGLGISDIRHLVRNLISAWGSARDDQAPNIRIAAATVLRQIERTQLLDGLNARGDRTWVVEQVCADLTSSHAELAEQCLQLLVWIGKNTVTELCSVLCARQPTARQRAARALGGIGDPRAVIPLQHCLQDPEVDVRMDTVGALAAIGSPEAVAALRARLPMFGLFGGERHAGVLSSLKGALAKFP